MSYDVIVAARGSCEYLQDSLVSIAEQSLVPNSVKVILDNDDIHYGELQDVAKRKFPTTEVRKSPGHGMITAVNFGISLCSSEFIAFLDSDDLWETDKQQQQIDALSANPRLDVVTSNALNVRTGQLSDQRSNWTPSITFTCATFRRSAFQKFGLIDESATHFNWLYRWWAFAFQVGICRLHLDSPGVKRRIHSSNSWITQNSRAHQDLFNELRQIIHRQARLEE